MAYRSIQCLRLTWLHVFRLCKETEEPAAHANYSDTGLALFGNNATHKVTVSPPKNSTAAAIRNQIQFEMNIFNTAADVCSLSQGLDLSDYLTGEAETLGGMKKVGVDPIGLSND